MPRRGYRKGIADTKVPLGRRIHTRLPDTLHADLVADATTRNTDAAKILRQLVRAHYTGHRLELPQPRGANAAALRELARIGNNVNQIAHQANLMNLHLLHADARACLATLNDLARRLARPDD